MSDLQTLDVDRISPAARASHERRVHRNHRLKRELRDLVNAYTSARFLGSGRFVEDMAAKAGIHSHELCIVDVLLRGATVTIVCVPYGGWTRPEFMERVHALRIGAKAQGRRVVVVPQGIVDRQPRLGNASIIGVAGKRVTVDATARMTVLAHLVENGDCSLSDLASLLDHPDPYGAILNLISQDVLRIDLRRCISPSSLVGLPNGDAVELE